MLPEFCDGLNLPAGGHRATWTEIKERFGVGTERRILLAERLLELLKQASHCGFRKVVFWGSFVTAKEEPGDFDLLWVLEKGLDQKSLSTGCQELLDASRSRERFGCDVLVCEDESTFLDFFISPDTGLGYDPVARKPRGLVILHMEDL